MRLREFVSADPNSPEAGWRRELVAGTVRVLPERTEEEAGRIAQVGTAIASTAKRGKCSVDLSLGSGVGLPGEDADDYRIADILLSLGNGRKRSLSMICHIVADPDLLRPDEADRLRVFLASPGVRDVLLFALEKPVCKAWRLRPDGWREQRHEGFDAAVSVASLPTSVFLASAYSDQLPEDGA